MVSRNEYQRITPAQYSRARQPICIGHHAHLYFGDDYFSAAIWEELNRDDDPDAPFHDRVLDRVHEYFGNRYNTPQERDIFSVSVSGGINIGWGISNNNTRIYSTYGAGVVPDAEYNVREVRSIYTIDGIIHESVMFNYFTEEVLYYNRGENNDMAINVPIGTKIVEWDGNEIPEQKISSMAELL